MIKGSKVTKKTNIKIAKRKKYEFGEKEVFSTKCLPEEGCFDDSKKRY